MNTFTVELIADEVRVVRKALRFVAFFDPTQAWGWCVDHGPFDPAKHEPGCPECDGIASWLHDGVVAHDLLKRVMPLSNVSAEDLRMLVASAGGDLRTDLEAIMAFREGCLP